MSQNRVLLFIDATIRPQAHSRTYDLCREYLEVFRQVHPEYEIRRRVLREENLSANMMEDITLRDQLVAQGDLSHPVLALAQEFAAADQILIGAPYWDLSFPALLKVYLEKACITGITFGYTETGIAPLCKARSLTYLTTCGGGLPPELCLGADYLRGMCKALFGIERFETASAELLDVEGIDTEAAMQDARKRVRALAEVSY